MFYYRPHTEYGGGYLFTPVCHSVHKFEGMGGCQVLGGGGGGVRPTVNDIFMFLTF